MDENKQKVNELTMRTLGSHYGGYAYVKVKNRQADVRIDWKLLRAIEKGEVEINKHIMQYENGYCSNDDIARIAIFAKANNLRPRMSCLLLKEGINDMNGIIRYLDYYNSLYIDNVIFRETMDYDEQAMKNHDKMAYLKNNKVYLNDIWKCIDKDNRFTPIKQLLGYYYYVEVYKYQGIDMVSESANLVKLYEQKQIANDVVFEMIFHPNGNLNGSWVDNEDILLAYNSYKS